MFHPKYLFYLFFFTITFSSNALFGQTYNPWASEDTTRIVKTNWLNSMGCYFDHPEKPCVELASDNSVTFRASIRMGTNDVTPYPEMRLRYFVVAEVPGGTLVDTGFTEPIINSMITPVVLETGKSAYEVAFIIHMDLSNDCAYANNFKLIAGTWLVNTTTYSTNPLVMTVDPYPVGDFPTLFPPALFGIPPSGKASPSTEKKPICCFDGVEPPYCGTNPPGSNDIVINPPEGNGDHNGGDTGSGGGFDGGAGDRSADLTSAGSAASFAAVFPNPFSNNLEASYRMESSGQISISCYDAQGRVLNVNQYQHQDAGNYEVSFNTDNWTPGIYYLHFETADQTKTMKVVKLKE